MNGHEPNMSQLFASQAEVDELDEELEEELGVRRLQRGLAVAGKRPRSYEPTTPPSVEEDEDAYLSCDLGHYFSQFDIPDKHVILMCRSYASYLSAKAHAEKK